MHHRNAPLTVVGRQRAVAQVIDSGPPIAHVAGGLPPVCGHGGCLRC